MNPRVEALQDFLDGKKHTSKAHFTNLKQDLTAHDKWIKKFVWGYVFVLTVIFGYFAFFTDIFNVFSNVV